MSNDLHDRLRAVGIEPCGDNSCIFGRRGGMGTNGGCRHLKDLRDMSPDALSKLVQGMAHVLRSTLPARPVAEIEIDRSPIISAAETYGRALAARRDSRDFDRFYAALLEHEEEVCALATPAPVPADLSMRLYERFHDRVGSHTTAFWRDVAAAVAEMGTLPARPQPVGERLVERADDLVRAIEDTEPTLGRARIVPREKATGIIRELIAALSARLPAPTVPGELADLLREQAAAHHAARGAQERALYTSSDAAMDAEMPNVEATAKRAIAADRAVVEWTRANLKESTDA